MAVAPPITLSLPKPVNLSWDKEEILCKYTKFTRFQRVVVGKAGGIGGWVSGEKVVAGGEGVSAKAA